MGWKAIGSSVKGTSHKQGNIPCQDYSEHKVIDDVIVGAVADGAGSAKFSNIGAKLAVKTALFHLEEFFKNLKEEKKRDLQQPIVSELAREVFREVFREILDKVKNELKAKASEQECDFNDLACTLLAFIATPDWIAAMQIGDGFIVIRAENSNEYKLFFPPDKGEYANETIFVTSKDADYKMDVLYNPKFICASTDGLERLAINFRDWKPSSGFFKPFEEGLKITEKLEQEEEDIKKWLTSEDVNTRTDDDKTLLLCLYEGESKSKIYSSHAPSINLYYIKPKEVAKQAISSPIIKDSVKVSWDFLIVSFLCNMLAGYLLASLWMQQNPRKWIVFGFGIAVVICVLSMTFTNLFKWFNKTRNKPINYKYKIKNHSTLIQLIYRIRAVIIVTLSNTILGLLLGTVLYLPFR
ncbi:hypothetical protein DSM106972_024040 [Dulcicalothrix desertica PCC 7102]|uniref:PPM-type phosphatase domain-containing protein n=1 Tax=Dulcicalothrix desertica PCC 7102 TaxID=232991 RepID=A0A3S5K3F2_9CYAN|nr:PP2C family serine/threonine-protein phosphatase [Dulcicalothrix desertica]RUT07143.1 hypothetical protein DSM106972_024040 [Dulcicalothrix desertica PCC 7102]TWH61860.1 protein phosphatase 2C-like protein [Dulcicalothrix desertica PCC 7102]